MKMLSPCLISSDGRDKNTGCRNTEKEIIFFIFIQIALRASNPICTICEKNNKLEVKWNC